MDKCLWITMLKKPLKKRKRAVYIKICQLCRESNDVTGGNSLFCDNCIKTGARHKYRLFKKYGLTIQQFNEMLEDQGFGCAICTTELIFPNVDHCHKTGKVRGLLCSRCNSGLGIFQDNPNTLASALRYLDESNAIDNTLPKHGI